MAVSAGGLRLGKDAGFRSNVIVLLSDDDGDLLQRARNWWIVDFRRSSQMKPEDAEPSDEPERKRRLGFGVMVAFAAPFPLGYRQRYVSMVRLRKSQASGASVSK